MNPRSTNPRVLIVTPEVSYLPDGMGRRCSGLNVKAGALGDVSAALINALYHLGADVHVALPNYRSIIYRHGAQNFQNGFDYLKTMVPEERIHLAQDHAFFYRSRIYSHDDRQNVKISLAFQREVLNHVIPEVRPDLIHCNDWMTALIPAAARKRRIPSLFTIHNIHTVQSTLADIEDRGIDAAVFWDHLYYERYPSDYAEVRGGVPFDFLTSGVFAAHFVNTVSPRFLTEIVEGRHPFINGAFKQELKNKYNEGCALGILNAPDASYRPSTDPALACPYSAADLVFGKKANKRALQKKAGLRPDVRAPLFFWPSRLDPDQKGCRLLGDILYHLTDGYARQGLQIVFIADGEFKGFFQEMVRYRYLADRIAVLDFDENLARLAYGAADFVLMPSCFEPCGLAQMIGPLYGALPVAHDTGGIHDTVRHLNAARNTGNGFLFEIFDSQGLLWAVNQAMDFFALPSETKQRQIRRIMRESEKAFNHEASAQTYIALYEAMLRRPLIGRRADDSASVLSPSHQPFGTPKVADFNKLIHFEPKTKTRNPGRRRRGPRTDHSGPAKQSAVNAR